MKVGASDVFCDKVEVVDKVVVDVDTFVKFRVRSAIAVSPERFRYLTDTFFSKHFQATMIRQKQNVETLTPSNENLQPARRLTFKPLAT